MLMGHHLLPLCVDVTMSVERVGGGFRGVTLGSGLLELTGEKP